MAAVLRFVGQIGRTVLRQPASRNISVSAVSRVVKVEKRVEDGNVYIEGVIVPQPREDKLIETKGAVCSLCSLGVDVKHTDVLILKQFLKPNGCMLPRRITQLCRVQHRRVEKLVAMAQRAGLMPNLNPDRDPKRKRDWRKFNTYYDETTIRHKYK